MDTAAALDTIADRALAQLRAAAPAIPWTDELTAKCRALAIASDFAIGVLARQPDLLTRLGAGDGEDRAGDADGR